MGKGLFRFGLSISLGRVVFLFVFFLVGCADTVNFKSISKEVAQEKTDGRLPPLGLVLLNEKGEEAPAEPLSGLSPLGVLLLQADDTEYYCSVSHIDTNRVMTSAHCIHSKTPSDYFVIHYDRNGKKQASPVIGFDFVGEKYGADVALLNIDNESAANWDVVKDKHWSPTLAQEATKPFTITISSFDPIRAHAAMAKKFGFRGMMYAPKHCDGSRKQPRFSGVDEWGIANPIGGDDEYAKLSLYYDNCSAQPIPGNSGGIVTMGSDFEEILGVHQKQVGPGFAAVDAYYALDYTTIAGVHVEKITEEAFDDGVYWEGISIADVQQQILSSRGYLALH